MNSQIKFDVTIIGAGPGGYVCAIRAAQLGLKVALIEKNTRLGGTCLNIGCIPSKALLDSSEEYDKINNHLSEHGISVSDVSLDLDKVMERKNFVVKTLTDGVQRLMKENKVTVFSGKASLISPFKVNIVENSGENLQIETQNIVLATGSTSVELPFLPYDSVKIISSTEALAFETIPSKLLIIGAGAIGLELGSVWSRFGADVTVIELLPQILPGMDTRIAKMLRRFLIKQGIDIHLETAVSGFEKTQNGISIIAKNKKQQTVTFEGDKVLVAVGRKPFTDGLGLENIGIKITHSPGFIPVNDKFQTSIHSIYAIGDLIGNPMLAHKAEDEGMAVAEIIAGKPGKVRYDTIPGIVYTWPEAASVGKTEEILKKEGHEYKTGLFNFRANGRALSMNAADGFVKIIADKADNTLLGVHILGPWASDLISEAVTIMELHGTVEDIANTIHAHPTLSEALKEAAMAVNNQSIHSSPPRKKR